MASVLTVVLSCLFFQAAVAVNLELCALTNTSDVISKNSSYIMISPGYYTPNTMYNVTISGLDSAMNVSLSASVGNSNFGYWENNSTNCSGILNFENTATMYKWTSPDDISANVTFKAYVQNYTVFYSYYRMLFTGETMITSTPKTSTMAYNSTSPMTYNSTSPMTYNSTGTADNATTSYYQTTTQSMKTTTQSGSASFQPLGAFALTSMVLLFATAKPLLS